MSTAPGSQSGFHNAPVTKSLLLCIGGCSLVAYLLDSRSLFHLQLMPNLTANHEFWRLITSHSVLTTSGEFFFGSIIIYHLRIIERQFGSSKYAAFFFVSSALSTILEVGTLAICRQFHLKFIPAGPYGFIFAALYQYYRMIPYTYQYRVFGINISNRVVNCLSVIPFLYYQYPSSIAASVCGLLSGVIYRSGFLRLNKFRFPGFLNRFASMFILPLLSTRSSRRSPFLILDHRGQEVQHNQTQTQARRHVPAQEPPQPIVTPRQPVVNEENIADLRAMFPQSSQEAITRALLTSDNDINRAVQFLLDHHN
ncbi:hypothetical protein RhiirA5_357372 [Rhizophagus irregularis]|uniref:CUE domain-containing protein n=1 Tax=Rhizophagus irregularis TaxID=588596 RepID=A0A2N0R9S7_9GLOM|nr:hypothetical protein RhiirA5_357372 [Rhizophagus irregularis]PKC60054.1 hypothetical protein RhiirA1_384229 [Rhizophagus irregularis]CAB4493650.1 unnamed protein product [Rhizophagus irregularis]CAB5183191.1 unnamed protein product [Rhizophagus irregularis]CAB5394604.1 unnamed protein product [Rhizophagus irregularis]